MGVVYNLCHPGSTVLQWHFSVAMILVICTITPTYALFIAALQELKEMPDDG